MVIISFLASKIMALKMFLACCKNELILCCLVFSISMIVVRIEHFRIIIVVVIRVRFVLVVTILEEKNRVISVRCMVLS